MSEQYTPYFGQRTLGFFGFLSDEDVADIRDEDLSGELACAAFYGALTGRLAPLELHRLCCLLHALILLRFDRSGKATRDMLRDFDAQVLETLPEAKRILATLKDFPDCFGPMNAWEALK